MIRIRACIIRTKKANSIYIWSLYVDFFTIIIFQALEPIVTYVVMIGIVKTYVLFQKHK